MKNIFIILLFLFSLNCVFAQQTKEVLFIGNSYTGFNNLPNLVYDVAISAGDTLIYDSHTPGGQRLLNHAVNATALSKIAGNTWDFVVLQGQSQEPSWPIGQVQDEVYPYAEILCDSIRSSDACSVPLFYMTWGRENGDSQNCPYWPPVCTYEGMDSLLTARYIEMATMNSAQVSPVGMVWNYIRSNFPAIQLYNADGSHPSLEGSYAAACAFYTLIFKSDPEQITFSSTIDSLTAANIRFAAKEIAYSSLESFDFTTLDPIADFQYQTLSDLGDTIQLFNESVNAENFYWNINGLNLQNNLDSAIVSFPVPTENDTTYEVILVAENCNHYDTVTQTIFVQQPEDTMTVSILEKEINFELIQLSKNSFKINSENAYNFFQMNIYDLNGKMIHSQNINSNEAFIVNGFNDQLLILKISDQQGNAAVFKIIL